MRRTSRSRTQEPARLLTRRRAALDDRVRGVDAGADDFLSKPFVLVELEARVRSLVRLKRYTDELDSAASVILSLGRTIEARDPHTQGHCERLAAYATALGAHLDLSFDQQLAHGCRPDSPPGRAGCSLLNAGRTP